MTEATIIKFDVEKKDETINPRQLRATGKLPATIYGKGVESTSVQLDAHSFAIVYRDNKEATYELNLDGKTFKAVIQAVQMNYSTNQQLNVEFKLV